MNIPRARSSPRWRCRDGRLIYPHEMDDSHLGHSINRIMYKNWRQHWLKRLLAEAKRRGITCINW